MSNLDVAITKSSLRISAAENVKEARMKDFQAALYVGSHRERQRCKDAVLAAEEALLDALDHNAWLLLKRQGIDPERRNER